MSRGKKPNVTPTVQWSIMVPVDLAFRVETQLLDPVTRRPSYAARSKLIQALLHDWMNQQHASSAEPAGVDTLKGPGHNLPLIENLSTPDSK